MLGAETLDPAFHGLSEEVGIVQIGFFTTESSFFGVDSGLRAGDGFFRPLYVLLECTCC